MLCTSTKDPYETPDLFVPSRPDLFDCLPVQAQEDPWQKFLREDRERTAQQKAVREARVERANNDLMDVVRGVRPSNPATLETAPRTQSRTDSVPEQYQTIVVNTPSGFVYKRCKVLNGQVVACF